MSAANVGVLGIGAFLPETIRTNDWWPKETVARWSAKALDSKERAAPSANVSAGMKLALDAMAEVADDPFQGSVERRVMAEDMMPSDMEAAACKEALSRANVAPGDIDFILTSSWVPDHLSVPNACTVHRKLGLRERCFSTQLDAACNGFLLAMELAQLMVASGRGKLGLLVQSSAATRLLPQDEPYSAWSGDGATAVVVGPAGPGRGMLGRAHRTNGNLDGALVMGVPGKQWYDEGRSYWYLKDRAAAFQMLASAADNAKVVVDEALAEAALSPEAVDFFAGHQSTRWFRRVLQEHTGLTRARFVDTFSWAGSLMSCNLPLILYVAQKEGLLREDDVVAMHTGGSGITFSGMVLRWGR